MMNIINETKMIKRESIKCLVCIISKLVNNISRIINSGIFYSYTILTTKDPYKEYFINQNTYYIAA